MGKPEARMPGHREEVVPRPSGAGAEREGWALSCGCSDLAGHPAEPWSGTKGTARLHGACSHRPAVLALPSCAPLACAPQHSSKSISFA